MRRPMKWRDDERELKIQMARLLELLGEILTQSLDDSSESWRAFNLSNVSGRRQLVGRNKKPGVGKNGRLNA